MAIQFRVVDPRQDILARYDDEKRMEEAATSRTVRRAHQERARAYLSALDFVDCYFRSCSPTPSHDPEFVGLRSLPEIRDDVVGGGIVRG